MLYSSKPSDDKIIMKNRGHDKSKQQEGSGSFLELYGKHHIRSEQISDNHGIDLTRERSMQQSPGNVENPQGLFEGL